MNVIVGQHATATLRNLKRKLFSTIELRLYRLPLANWNVSDDGRPADIDNWDHLHAYDESAGWLSRSDFLAEAERRMARGEQVVTVVRNGTLAHYGWLVVPAGRRYISEIRTLIELPARAAYVYDFFTHRGYRNKGLYQQTLRMVLADLRRRPDVDDVFIGVESRNSSSRAVIEKIGFSPFCSLWQQRSWGSCRSWFEQVDPGFKIVAVNPQEMAGLVDEHSSAERCYRFCMPAN
jgi:RimJ/RimL family protein N-acetyltransferase